MAARLAIRQPGEPGILVVPKLSDEGRDATRAEQHLAVLGAGAWPRRGRAGAGEAVR